MNINPTKHSGEPILRLSSRVQSEIEELKILGNRLKNIGVDCISYTQGNGDWNVTVFLKLKKDKSPEGYPVSPLEPCACCGFSREDHRACDDACPIDSVPKSTFTPYPKGSFQPIPPPPVIS